MRPEDQTESSVHESEFMRLFLRHENVLRAYARSILPDWNSVDDAVQESSVTMLEKLGQLRNEAGFLPWAKVIVRYKCLSLAAMHRRERPLLSQEVLELLADEAETVTPDCVADVRNALSSCMAELSSDHQELLLAPYSGDARVKELAEQTGKTANALYKSLGRLRDKVARCVRSKVQAAGA